MIILVTLMVTASQVLSIPIDDITHDSSYVAIDSSVPIRIDPEVITRIFRDQSPHSGSSSPFKEGFYYTVPARLLLYQPPTGQSYQAGRSITKEHSNCDHQRNPVMGGYFEGPHPRYERSDGHGISAVTLPQNRIPGEPMFANHYDAQSILTSDHIQSPYPSSAAELAGKYASVPSLSPNRRPHLYEDTNSQGYGAAYYPDGTSDSAMTQTPLIPPSYLLGVKVLTNTPSSFAQGRPIWDSPNFPKHMVEPWASAMYGDSAYLAGRSTGVQSQPTDLSRYVVTDLATSPIGFRPPPYGYSTKTKAKTPWVVLMVPPDSLLRKEYNAEIKSPWLSISPKMYGANTEGYTGTPVIPPCQRGNVDVAGSHSSQRGNDQHPTSNVQHPVSGSSKPLLDEVSVQEGPSEAESAVLPFPKSSTKLQSQDQPNLNLAQTIVTSGNIIPSKATEYATSDSSVDQLLIEPTGKDQAMSSKLGDSAKPASQVQPRGTVHAIIEEVNIDGSPTKNSTSGLQPLAGESTGWNHLDVEGIESEDSLISGISSTQQPINDANSDYTGPIEESKTTLDNEASDASISTTNYDVQSTPNVEDTMDIGGEDLGENMSSQDIDQPDYGTESPHQSFPDSDVTPQGDTGMAEEERSSREDAENAHSQDVDQPDDVLESPREASPDSNVTPQDDTGMAEQENTSREDKVAGDESLSTTTDNSQWSSISSGSAGMQQVEEAITLDTEPLMERKNSKLEAIGESTVTGSAGSQPIIEQYDSSQPTTGLFGALSSSKTVDYIASGGVAQENLGKESLSLKIGETSLATRDIDAGVRGAHEIIEQGRDIKTNHVERDGVALTQVIRYVTKGIADSTSHVKDMIVGQEGQSTATGFNYAVRPQEYTEQASALGSTVKHLNGAPSASKTIRYFTSGGMEGGNLGEHKIVLQKGGPSTVSRHISLGTQQNTEGGEPEAPQAVSALDDGGGSNSIVRYVTSGLTDGKIISEDKIGIGNVRDSTVSRNVSPGGSGVQQIIQKEATLPTSSALTVGGDSSSQMSQYVMESSMGETENAGGANSGSEAHSPVPYNNYSGNTGPQQILEQAGSLGSTTNLLQASPSTSRIIQYITTGGAHNETLGEASVVSGGSSSQQIIEYGKGPHTISTLVGGGDSASQVVQYIDEGSKFLTPQAGEMIAAGPEQMTEEVNGDGLPTTILAGAPSSSKTIRYVTTGAPQEIEQPDSLQATTTIIKGPPLTKTIRYVIPRGNDQVSMGGSNIATGSPSTSPVTQVSEGSNSQSESYQITPSSSQVIRYINQPGAGILLENYTTVGNDGLQQFEGQGSSGGSSTIRVEGAPSASKIIHYWTGRGIEGQGSEFSEGVVPKSTATIVREVPIRSKIIRYITTADGEQRQEIVGDASLELENQGLPGQIEEAGLTQRIETNNMPVKTSKIIRYVTTAGGVGREIHGDASMMMAAEEPEQAQVQTTTLLEGVPTVSRTIQVGGVGIDQQQGQPITVTRIIKTGGAGTQQVMEEGENSDSKIVMEGFPSSYKTIRYVTNDGGDSQQMVDTDATNLPSETITRYITMPGSDTASDGPSTLQQGGSTVTRYITVPGSGSQTAQFLSGPGNMQSSRSIVQGVPSTVTRYITYPQSGAGGMRYMQTLPPRIATVVKPVTYISGTLPKSAQ